MKLADTFVPLKNKLKGELFHDEAHRILYATDASIYREKPRVVVRPKTIQDVQETVLFSNLTDIPIVARAGGTSLGGQVVGNGIILDFSMNWSRVLELNKNEKWARIQPGIVRDELNRYLSEFNLFFAPETSTSNRCMLGGMVGNNSCGSHSLLYGSTRDHLLEVDLILSDGSLMKAKALNLEEYNQKLSLDTLEGALYKKVDQILRDSSHQQCILENYPKASIHRRNTGYALDLLLQTEPFGGKEPFNFSKLIAGSEGTLGIITEIKISLSNPPPPVSGIVAVHMDSIQSTMRANLLALEFEPSAIELMDKKMLECAFLNRDQRVNAGFIKGIPEALLIVEFQANNKETITKKIRALTDAFKKKKYGSHFPTLFDEEINKVWNLRKAGLGSLSNMPGDPKPIACIEDTAVDVQDQPEYIRAFQKILDQYRLDCIYYGHIGDGELHLRPILNLKLGTDRKILQILTKEVAKLIKEFRGSLSGEHGDGRVRAPYIELVLGSEIYQLLKEFKGVADPKNLFNPGKILRPKTVDSNLRYKEGQKPENFNTYFDFSEAGGMLKMAEKCNGSGDCRKSYKAGGTMCPSFMASGEEKDSTRGRANILREYLTNSIPKNRFAHKEVKEVLDLCLSCKACKTECPSNVDMAMLKAEYLQRYNDKHGLPIRSWLVGNYALMNKILSRNPTFSNFLYKNRLSGRIIKEVLGFARQRDLPRLSPQTLRHWIAENPEAIWAKGDVKGSIYLFVDEFTNYQAARIGIQAIDLITHLGYNILIKNNSESGRALLSKGMVRKTRYYARKNLRLYRDAVSEKIPLIGIEPSAILMFRDEYPKLVGKKMQRLAEETSANTFFFDEWMAREIASGKIKSSQFTDRKRSIKWHGHCQQKALSNINDSLVTLSIPENYSAEEIHAGCCGMAGSFGFEKEHYDMSIKIGELVLFPEVRKYRAQNMIASSGISCRHQIQEGTRVQAKHPIELLHDALKK